MKRGLLLTLTEPPPAMEEEFNAWYDQEHLAERLSIPGFRSAQRWMADVPQGSGKYLATYELDSAAVLQSPAYLARFQNQSPWSRRCLGKAVVFKRWVCEQIEPGDAEPHAAAAGVVYTMSPAKLAGVLQMRRFAAASGETINLYELFELRQPGAIVYRLYKP
jgi:hypothetical protein